MGFSSADKTSYLDIALELMAGEPDGLAIVANSLDSAMLCQQIRKIDSRVKITLTGWGATERLLELGGLAVEGVTMVQPAQARLSPQYQTFEKIFFDHYHRKPGPTTAQAYDATQVILAAIRSQKKNQDLKAALLSLGSVSGLQYEIEFTPFGDTKNTNLSINIIRNRQYVVLEESPPSGN